MSDEQTIREFMAQFPDDRAAAAFLAELRWPEGRSCDRCGCPKHHQLTARPRVFQCATCKRQVSVTAGTVMHRSHLPLRFWFAAAWAMSQPAGISARMLARLLEVSYESMWLLLHKLRRALDENPAFPLRNVVEMHEVVLRGKRANRERSLPPESAKTRLVTCAVERDIAFYAGGHELVPGSIRLGVVPYGRATVPEWLQHGVAKGSALYTTRHHSPSLNKAGFRWEWMPGGPKQEAMLYVTGVLTQVESWLVHTHRRVSGYWLQSYLQEFTWRFNRRYVRARPSFLLRRAMRGEWIPAKALTAPAPYPVAA